MIKDDMRCKDDRRDAKSCVSTVCVSTGNKRASTSLSHLDEPDPSYLFKNKYRVESTRLKNWDYSSNGWYYVTLCEKNRENVFGNVENRKMNLSAIGKNAEQCWQNIPNHFPFVELDEFVIMPNHVHGIIVINKSVERVETQDFASLSKFGPQSRNLASIIRGFKIGVTKYAKENDIPFLWQPRYYDHIIRDNDDLYRIREYIINNPLNWDSDENNIKNIIP